MTETKSRSATGSCIQSNTRLTTTHTRRRGLRESIILVLLSAMLLSFAPGVIASPPAFNIINVGLTGPEYTHDDGFQISEVRSMNEVGQISGYSLRYDNDAGLARVAWLYDGSSTQNIGLTDSVHTRYDGFQFSEPSLLDDSGQVIGYSSRFNGLINGGRTAWLYDGNSTLNVGLTDAEHTSNSGFQSSNPDGLNKSGQVIGTASRNPDSTYVGQTAWLYDGSTTFNIGLTSAEHTRDDGHRNSDPSQLNEAGQVTGYAERYGGSSDLGRSAWLYNGSTTVDISLTGAEHTRDDGYRFSSTAWLNEAGQVVGRSRRYDGSTSNGQTAWLYDGSSTLNIGLTDPEHTNSNAYQFSNPDRLNEAGLVSGYSNRYAGTTDMGRTAWLYDGATTLNIGLTDLEHTRDDGYQFSRGVDLNEAGQVIGYSDRFEGGPESGRTAWLYDGTTTINIGLTGSEYTRDDGLQYNSVELMNEAGQASGSAARFDGSTNLGGDAWVYDSELGTVPLRLSVRDDGFSSSGVRFLGEDGLTLGVYALYDGMSFVGFRPFYWSPDDGLWDLANLVDGGLADNGWADLEEGLMANGLGYISGQGIAAGLPEGSQSAFLLVPVPEPSSFALAALGFVGVFGWRLRLRVTQVSLTESHR